jgi:hypothetical protein
MLCLDSDLFVAGLAAWTERSLASGFLRPVPRLQDQANRHTLPSQHFAITSQLYRRTVARKEQSEGEHFGSEALAKPQQQPAVDDLPTIEMTDSSPGEEQVLAIEGHHGHGKHRKYHVLWANGERSEEFWTNLVDPGVDGEEETINEKLLEYWDRHPWVKFNKSI